MFQAVDMTERELKLLHPPFQNVYRLQNPFQKNRTHSQSVCVVKMRKARRDETGCVRTHNVSFSPMMDFVAPHLFSPQFILQRRVARHLFLFIYIYMCVL